MLQARPSVRASRDWLRPALFCAAAVPLLDGSLARGYAVDVDATVIGQGYQLNTADASGAVPVDRRRMTTYLGLTLGDIGRKDADGLPSWRDQFSMTVQLRLDSDFADYPCSIGRISNGAPLTCVDPSQSATAVRTDPELTNHRPELLLAYAEGRGLGGLVDVRIGRQILWDLFDMRGFDGGWLSVRTPIYLALEAFGGLSQNGALIVDSSPYVLDGTSRDPRRPFDDPRQQFQALQPTVGVAVKVIGLRDFQARLAYRQTSSATQDTTPAGCVDGQPCAPTTGRIEEKIAATVQGRLFDGKLQGFGGLRYDLLNGRFDDGQAGVRGSPSRGHFVSAEYRFSAPTWDGDSIFNVFAAEPYQHAQLAYDGRSAAGPLSPLGEFSWHARAFARFYRASDGARPEAGDLSTAAGGDVGVRYKRKNGFARLDVYCDGGYGGLRAGSDLNGRLMLYRDSIGLEGRLYYMYWADDQRDTSRSHGVSMQAGVRWSIPRGVLLHVLVEDNVDRFYNSQLRLMANIDLSFALGPRGGGRPPVGLLGAGFGDFPAPGIMPGFYQ